MLLTEKEKLHLSYLSEILDFGADKLKEITKTDNFSHLQNYLLYSFVPVHNFSESIYILCNDSRPHAAQVLLRSIFEAYMTTEYIKSSDTEKRLALFAKDSFRTRMGIIHELESFNDRYPNLEKKSTLLKKENIQDLKKFTERHIKDIDESNNLNKEKLPNFINRIKIIDEETLGDNKGMNELNYHILYRQLSQYTHLSSWGLELFAEQGPESITYSLGQEKEVDHIVEQTFLYYFDLLNNLYINKVVTGEISEVHSGRFEEIKSEIRSKSDNDK